MEKKNLRKIEIGLIVAVLLIGVGVTYAYFRSSPSVEGAGTKVEVTTASVGDTILKIEGSADFKDLDIYPGHKTISRLKLTATGDRQVTYNLIWEGTNTLKTPLKYQIYKTESEETPSISCAKTSEVQNGLKLYYETCTNNNFTNLGTPINEGEITTSNNITKILKSNETAQATKEGKTAYYYVVLEYENKEESQNIDINGEFTGKIKLEITSTDAKDYILANNTIDASRSSGVFTENFTEDTAGRIFSTKDDDGDTYFFAGTNPNNWVEYGKYQHDLYVGHEEIIEGNGDEAYLTYESESECKAAGSWYDCVKLASKGDPIYWRIIRINGDNTIRMIYNGPTTNQTGLGTSIGQTGFNEKEDDNAYVGYMYGKVGLWKDSGRSTTLSSPYLKGTKYYGTSYTFNEETGEYSLSGEITSGSWSNSSNFIGKYTCNQTIAEGKCTVLYYIESYKDSNYANAYQYTRVDAGGVTYYEAHANTNNSTIKTYADNWYKTNILGQSYEKYLDINAGFCNDRSLSPDTTGTGAGKSSTDYAPYYRYNNTIATHKCNTHDLFTTKNSSKGNKALTYPIGLMTIDDAMYAGVTDIDSHDYWLYTGRYYWFLSPCNFNDSAMTFDIYSDGNLDFTGLNASYYGVRPVINLKADVQLTGNGTVESPYRIAE